MPFDLYHNVNVQIAIAPVTGAVAVSVTGVAVDMQDCRNALWIVQATGSPTADATNFLTFTIEESVNGTSGWVSLNASAEGKRRLHTTGEGTAFVDVIQRETLTPTRIGSVRGTARYQRLVLVETGAVTISLSAVAILHTLRSAPASGT